MEFIKQKTTENGVVGVDTALFSNSNIPKLDCIKLDDNRVFIAIAKSGLIGILCSVENMEINILKTIDFSINAHNGINPAIVKLSNNKLVICYYDFRQNSVYQYRCVLCSIDGTEVTVGIPTDIGYSSRYNYLKAFKLADNKMILFKDSSGGELVAVIITVNEDMSFSISAETDLKTATTNQQQMDICQMTDNTFIIVLRGNANLLGAICKVIDAAISIGTFQTISDKDMGYGLSTARISDSEVLITGAYFTNYKMYIANILCSIDDITITTKCTNVNSDTELYGLSNGSFGYFTSTIMISKNIGIIVYINKSNTQLCYIMFTLTEDSIKYETEQVLSSVVDSGYLLQCLLLNESAVMILHNIATKVSSNNYYTVSGIIYDSKIEKLVQKIKNKQGTIAGIAKTNAEDGQLAEIITPNYEEVI